MTKDRSQRCERVTLRLTSAERETLVQRAAQQQLSVSAYLRRVSLQTSPGARSRTGRDSTYHQLCRLGNHLERLARTSEQTHRLPEAHELKTMLETLRGLLADLHASRTGTSS